MTLVTLSAAYGAGGSRVGPQLARRLDVPFFDRVIPASVAERLAVPLQEALAHDEARSGALGRMLLRMAPLAQLYGSPPAHHPDVVDDDAYRCMTEQVIREHAAGGDAVFLGRAAAVVLAGDPRALHVRLDGPRERRVAQAVEVEGVAVETAERRIDESDRAREAYVRHFYGTDPHDRALYHLVIDSTAIGLDACVALIADAARARR